MDLDNLDRFDRDVVVRPVGSGGYARNLVHDLHALRHFSEYTVAKSLRGGGFEIEERIIGDVNEELACGAVDIRRPRHGERALLVLQSVGRFIFNRRLGWLLGEVLGESATLDHEALDHAVKDCSVVVFGIHILKEVLYRRGSLVLEQLDLDIAFGCLDNDHGMDLLVGCRFIRYGCFDSRILSHARDGAEYNRGKKTERVLHHSFSCTVNSGPTHETKLREELTQVRVV